MCERKRYFTRIYCQFSSAFVGGTFYGAAQIAFRLARSTSFDQYQMDKGDLVQFCRGTGRRKGEDIANALRKLARTGKS